MDLNTYPENLDGVMARFLSFNSTPKKLVLIVDDNQEVLLTQKLALRPIGAKIVAAKSVNDAIKFLQFGQPDLIVTDLIFPESNSGYDILEYVGVSARLRHVPTLVMSGKADVAFIDQAYLLDAVDYIQKPFVPAQLLKTVNFYL
jgi:CheY-like chemotaxis protein